MKKLTTKQYVLIGTLLVLLGLFLIFGDYFASKKFKAYETINLEHSSTPSYVVETEEPEENINNEENVEDTPIKEENPDANYYIGTLSIPKIALNKGFASIESPYNDVENNIKVLEYSDYPNVKKGNFIIAGHSGTAWNSFFRDLYKLEINDKAYVTYNNKKYEYKIVDIYYQEKTGKIRIYRDYNKTTMTLITCTKNDKTKQTVYILEQMR